MKMRAQKHFQKLIKLGKVLTVQLFIVSRKKDDKVVKIVDSKQEATALINRAKLAKKASLHISHSYRQKYARHYESHVR